VAIFGLVMAVADVDPTILWIAAVKVALALGIFAERWRSPAGRRTPYYVVAGQYEVHTRACYPSASPAAIAGDHPDRTPAFFAVAIDARAVGPGRVDDADQGHPGDANSSPPQGRGVT
jgi:hypothetical protein